ncbi:IS66 family transposase [Spirochaetia bacterium]|nr:IS66 family transposase [Spirochaetia bacterium]
MRIAEAGTTELPASVREYITQLEHENLVRKQRLDLLLYKRFGRSAEQLLTDKKQMPLFAEEPETAADTQTSSAVAETQEIKPYTRKKPGRKPIDPNLPRKEIIIDIREEEKVCACGAEMVKIGEETSEKVVIIPPRMYVEKTIRPKYACRTCEGIEDEDKPTVRIAPVPPAIIPRSIASASLLAYIMIQKYQDHLPYYRQEQLFGRFGIEISRQDMANWQQQIYTKLTPLFDMMKQTVRAGPVLQMDETTVQVMGEEGRTDTQKSYMWLARSGPPGKTVVWYEYHPTRAHIHAKTFLEGFSGYLQTDGYEGYDKAITGRADIIHVGCFAHARRYFFEAAKVTKKPQSAEEGIKHIRKLYRIEEQLRSENREEQDFLAERKRQVEPVLTAFRSWLEKRAMEVPPSLLLGKAVAYTLNQWDKLIRYLESPHLTPDNNACENAIRPFVLGRKNWLFNKSPAGAESSCGIYSLIETAKQNGLEPLDYLRNLFERAPLAVSPDDWEKLLPWNIVTA